MRTAGHLRRQRGLTLPLLALMIVAFFVMAALALDLGVFYTARTSAQHAADAAALAGAYSFLNPLLPQPSSAQNAAIAAAASNKILGQSATISSGNVVVDTANRRVTVTVPRIAANGIPTFFSRVTGRARVDVMATATAEASATASGSRCVKPVYLPTTILSSKAVNTACAQGEVIINSSGSLTSYATSRLGQQFVVKPGDPAQALAPGQFYALDFGAGANTYRCTLGQCLNFCNVSPPGIMCGDSYPVKTGNMVGPTRQGVDDLIGNPPNTFVAVGQYQDASGQIWDTSRSLAIAPIWDDCVQTISPGYAGQRVTVKGFATIFIDGMRGQNVTAHLVGLSSCQAGGGAGGGAGGAGAAGGGTGPMALSVRLIHQ